MEGTGGLLGEAGITILMSVCPHRPLLLLQWTNRFKGWNSNTTHPQQNPEAIQYIHGEPINEPSDREKPSGKTPAGAQNNDASGRLSHQTTGHGRDRPVGKKDDAPRTILSRRSHTETTVSQLESSKAENNDSKPCSVPAKEKNPSGIPYADQTSTISSPTVAVNHTLPVKDKHKDDKTTERNVLPELPSNAINARAGTNPKMAPVASQKMIKGLPAIVRSVPTRRHSPILRLPAELCLVIYEYLFDTHRVEILRLKDKDFDNPKRTRYRLYHRQIQPRDTNTQAAPCRAARFSPSPLPLGLIFTCKKIYHETLLLLYANTQFIFNSTRAVTRFLRVTDKVAQSAIHHVELNHHMYNEPRLTEFRVYKHRSDFAWYLACEGMSDAFTSLRVLHINMTIRDWPIHLELDERWAYPLLAFGRKNLDYADIKLHMVMFKEERLDAIARVIEKEIMKPIAYQIKDDERIAREMMGPVKAIRSLKLIF